MKTLPSLLAAAALIGGGALAAATPATAQNAKDAAKQAQLTVSKEIRAIYPQAQAAIAARDVATAEPLVAQIEAAAKNDDERYVAAALRLNVAKLKLSQPGTSDQSLAGPLDTLIANPKTPVTDQASFNLLRAQLAYNARDYKGALTYLERAKQLGNTDPNLSLLMTRARIDSGDVAGGVAALDQSIAATTAAGGKTDEQIYRYAVAQSLKVPNNGPASMTWIQRLLAAYPTKKNWRDYTVAWGIQGQALVNLEKQQKLDLFRLLRAGNALADEYDYLLYARYAGEVGLPYEAKTVITEGQRAGKIPAGNAEAKQTLSLANAAIANDSSLAAMETRARAGTGKLALATADGFLGSDNFAKAADLYRLALQKGGVDANTTNLRLGIALARGGDKEGARAAFASVTTWPLSGVGALWTTFLDHPPVG